MGIRNVYNVAASFLKDEKSNKYAAGAVAGGSMAIGFATVASSIVGGDLDNVKEAAAVILLSSSAVKLIAGRNAFKS